LPLEVKNEACVGVVLAAGAIPATTSAAGPITGLAEAARMPGVELFHAGTARDGDRLVTSGGRVLVVTATGPTMTEAAVRAYDAAERIQFDGKHLRRGRRGGRDSAEQESELRTSRQTKTAPSGAVLIWRSCDVFRSSRNPPRTSSRREAPVLRAAVEDVDVPLDSSAGSDCSSARARRRTRSPRTRCSGSGSREDVVDLRDLAGRQCAVEAGADFAAGRRAALRGVVENQLHLHRVRRVEQSGVGDAEVGSERSGLRGSRRVSRIVPTSEPLADSKKSEPG
jgi:hypothetical protein